MLTCSAMLSAKSQGPRTLLFVTEEPSRILPTFYCNVLNAKPLHRLRRAICLSGATTQRPSGGGLTKPRVPLFWEPLQHGPARVPSNVLYLPGRLSSGADTSLLLCRGEVPQVRVQQQGVAHQRWRMGQCLLQLSWTHHHWVSTKLMLIICSVMFYANPRKISCILTLKL